MLHLAIAIGGMAGALARHGAGLSLAAWAGSGFPWGTLAVNLGGSWVLGLFVGLLPASAVPPAIRAGLTVGFCGGFTTFSAFAFETMALARLGHMSLAAAYVAASLLLGVLSIVAGMAAGSLLRRHGQPPPPAGRAEPGR